MKSFVLPLLLAFLLSTSIQGFSQKKHHNPEMRKELRAYSQENILPVLREQRLKLDNEISAADKKEIDVLRAKRQKLHDSKKALHKKYKAQGNHAMAPATEAQKAEHKALHEQHKQIHAAAMVIAERYKTQLERIKAENSTNSTKWKNDLKAIMIKYNPDFKENTKEEGKRHHGMAKHAHFRKLMQPANFILWDGTIDKKSLTPADETSVYPNPASTNNNLEYKVAKKGNVKVLLLDANGNTLRTLLNEQKDKGKYTLEVNLSDLPNGTYYYKIETAKGIETKRVLKR